MQKRQGNARGVDGRVKNNRNTTQWIIAAKAISARFDLDSVGPAGIQGLSRLEQAIHRRWSGPLCERRVVAVSTRLGERSLSTAVTIGRGEGETGPPEYLG